MPSDDLLPVYLATLPLAHAQEKQAQCNGTILVFQHDCGVALQRGCGTGPARNGCKLNLSAVQLMKNLIDHRKAGSGYTHIPPKGNV